jgi:hypothetical protein
VAAGRAGGFVSKASQGSHELFTRDVPGKPHTAITSPRTKRSRMTLDIWPSSKRHRTASRARPGFTAADSRTSRRFLQVAFSPVPIWIGRSPRPAPGQTPPGHPHRSPARNRPAAPNQRRPIDAHDAAGRSRHPWRRQRKFCSGHRIGARGAPKATGVPTVGTPVAVPREESGAYFSPISLTFTLPFRLAWAAASLATGMR